MTPHEVCKTHQQVFVWTCSFFVFCSATIVGYMVINNNRAIAAETLIATNLSDAKLVAQIEHAEMMEKVTIRMNDGFQEIRQRLSRIEAKLQ